MANHAWSELTHEGDNVFVKRVGSKLVVSVTVGGRTEQSEVSAHEAKHGMCDLIVVQIRSLMQRIRSKAGR